jgi:REP element-mobilizing transposase RayT
MAYPLAWYITWTTYGTWLHGDKRGSYIGKSPIAPDTELEAMMRDEMTEDPVYLSEEQRAVVEACIRKECEGQGWRLHTVNARTNHVHVVLSAQRDGKFLRSRLKALTSDALSELAGIPMNSGKDGRRRWWTEKGNIFELETEKGLEEVIVYARDLQ